MNIYTFNCPNCGAPINLDYDNPQSFCGSCGSKIVLDISQLKDLLREKEHTKQEAERTKRDIEKTKRKIEQTKQLEKNNELAKVIVPLIVFILIRFWCWFYTI